MPIDPNIILGIRQPQIQVADPLESATRAFALKNAMQQGDLQSLQLKTAQTDADSNERLRALFASNPNPTTEQVMAIDPQKGLTYRKLIGDVSAQETKNKTENIELLTKATAAHRDELSGVNDPQSAAAWVTRGYNDPILGPVAQKAGSLDQLLARIPQDPAAFNQWKQQNALGAAKFIEEQRNAATAAEAARHNKATEANTLRGQNMEQSRYDATQSKPVYNADAGGFIVPGKNGAVGTVVPAAGMSPKLTEFQGKSLAFGSRAAAANEILDAVGQGGKVQPGLIKRSLEAVPFIGESLGTAANVTQSPAQQRIEQAQRDFVNAVLRQESGAYISQSEFDNAKKQYFPQPGDSAQVIAQKKLNRENVIQSFTTQAGNAGGHVTKSGQNMRETLKSAIDPKKLSDDELLRELKKSNG